MVGISDEPSMRSYVIFHKCRTDDFMYKYAEITIFGMSFSPTTTAPPAQFEPLVQGKEVDMSPLTK